MLRAPTKDDTDGPDDLKKLLRLGGNDGPVERDSLAVLRNVLPQFLGSHWVIKADVVVKKRDKEIWVTPKVALNVEAGKALPVDWETLELVGSPAGVSRKGSSFQTNGQVGRFTFKGTTSPSALPVDPRRCSARLGLVAAVKGAKE